jgi:hypothetical protein
MFLATLMTQLISKNYNPLLYWTVNTWSLYPVHNPKNEKTDERAKAGNPFELTTNFTELESTTINHNIP